jgi:nitroimidazol reductase NimA-like FMN-containing flavoprotein (pyridoxamine 5'-phosphate oxidase superfamily)
MGSAAVTGAEALTREECLELLQYNSYVGRLGFVLDPTELETLRRGPLKSWVSPGPQQWVRVSIDEISGRRIPGG